ncbi:MAG: PAS domain S-box protein [Syntrophobacteraceae bacterium]|jgi:PAS domain S-box-containing protein
MNDTLKAREQLIQELIELRRQVSELSASEKRHLEMQEALRASESKYRTLVENIPQRILHKDRNSVYVSCNRIYARDLKIMPDEIIGRTDYEFYSHGMAEKYIADDRRIMSTGEMEDIEERYIKNGHEVVVHTVKTPIKDDKGHVVGILGIFWDITKQKQAEEELQRYRAHLEELVWARTAELQNINEHLQQEITERKRSEDALRVSEQKYSSLLENSLTGIYIDQDGRIQFANSQFAEIYGYTRDEVVGMEIWRLVHPNDQAFVDEIRVKRLKVQDAPLEYEARGVTKDGETIWVKRRNTLITYNGKPAILGNVVDNTKNRQMAVALRESEDNLRHLSSHLLTAQERERARISSELHDDLGQALALLKFKVRSIGKKVDVELKEDCENALVYLIEIIENVRKLSRDLSPSILKGLGLWAALRWLLQNFAKHSKMEVTIDMADVTENLNEETQIMVYRIFQEALTNIGKHSQASHVSVTIQERGGGMLFIVADDGRGIDLERLFSREPTERGLGMTTMDERARCMGGTFQVSSQEGSGTRITFWIPADSGGNHADLPHHSR